MAREEEDEIREEQEAPEAPGEDESVGLPKRLPADWEEDEKAFAKHFGIAYADFTELVLLLDPKQTRKYEKTVRVNKEAAILWAIHEGKSHGLLTESSDE